LLLVVEQGRCGPLELERVDRLDQLGIGLGLASDPLVCVAIEQHQDAGVRDPPRLGLVPEVDACGNAPHVADLQVEDDQVGVQLGHRWTHIGPAPDSAYRGAVAAECGKYLFGEVIGIGGQENVRHGADRNAADMLRDTPLEVAVLEITIEEGDDYTLCRPAGELDAYTVGQFREALTSLAEHSRVLIDLSDVPFMDSAGLGALIGGIRRARESEGEVVVACSRPNLTRLLHTTGFDRIVPVTESIEEAEAAFGQEQADD